MGIRGSATCALNFDDATGYLIGEENRGLAAMFKMMNIERLTVGMQGLGFAEIAYQNALAYAQDRRQSKAPGQRPDPDKAADPIIYQPEMKRQLLRMRSQIEGARALAVLAGLNVDIMEKTGDADADATVALLTPIVKAYFSDLGMESTLSAQQIYGGHGYVWDHGMEQLPRDCRITQIYEGTNEVQALDLASRKITGKTGEFTDRFLAGWQEFLAQHADDEQLADFTGPASAALERLLAVTTKLREQLETDQAAARGSATSYLRVFALTLIACLWTQMMVVARDKDGEFYDTKRKVGRFYMAHVLPEALSLASIIETGNTTLADFDVADFGS